jgi:hypothetical protein
VALLLCALCDLRELCVKFRGISTSDITSTKKSGPEFTRGRSTFLWIWVGYWTMMLIGDATGVAAGVVVIAMVVEPCDVRLSVPLCDAAVVLSPR